VSKLIGVHGFCFDPASPKNSPAPLFSAWSKMLQRPVEGLAYYSYPIGGGGYIRAVKEGYVGEYHAAFHRAAPAASDELLKRIEEAEDPVDIIAHSLGSRVTLLALNRCASFKVRRVLLLEGAELQPNIPQELPQGTEVLNVCSGDDRVLHDLGSVFNGQTIAPCIGERGLGRKMAGWTDMSLTDPATRAAALKAKGWQLDAAFKGTTAHDLGGHWRAYEDPSNAPAYRAWFEGDDFSWARAA
jgi:pimeloyl-ACP methyl ester carboxylesterase